VAPLGVEFSSVAGDCGATFELFVSAPPRRRFSTYCSGLRGRLFSLGVKVVDIRPGFVDYPHDSLFIAYLPFASRTHRNRLAPPFLRPSKRGAAVVLRAAVLGAK